MSAEQRSRKSQGSLCFRLCWLAVVVALQVLLVWGLVAAWRTLLCLDPDVFLANDDCNWCQCKSGLMVCTQRMCSALEKQNNRRLFGRGR